MVKKGLLVLAASAVMASPVMAHEHEHGHHGHESAGEAAVATDQMIAQQRETLAKNTEGKGFGPQSPRDIDSAAGSNPIVFDAVPAYTDMNLCNIHFHKNAEHKGGEFTVYAGNGEGYQSGYKYSGKLSHAEMKPLKHEVCEHHHGHGALQVGDTIEVHYVYSTAQVVPGPTLKSCLSEAINNPQLRVEAQVYVLVNDKHALDFKDLTSYKKDSRGLYQATGIPNNTGKPVEYEGSTTGPGYNEAGSPFQVTWNVRPKVAKVDIHTVGEWCDKNDFNEDHGHGVRNLVKNPALLSQIK